MRASLIRPALGPLSLLLLTLTGSPAIAASQAQDPAAPANVNQDLRLLQTLDEIVAVVGNESITMSELHMWLQADEWRELTTRVGRLPAEEQQQAYNRLQMEALAQITEQLLRARAGRDRGFEPALVANLVDSNFERRRENLGGSVPFRSWLDSLGLTPGGYRKQLESNLLRQVWISSTIGRQPGPLGRYDRDFYVRPGLMLSTYEDLAASKDAKLRAEVGGIEAKVKLSALVLAVASYPSQREAIERADELRRRVMEDGEDFAKAVMTYSEQGRLDELEGNLERMRLASQDNFGNDAMMAFAKSAAEGEVCRPMLSKNGGVFIFQLVSRTAAEEAAPFSDLEVQARVRNWIQSERTRMRLGRATEELLRHMNVEPRELARFMARPAWLYRTGNH